MSFRDIIVSGVILGSLPFCFFRPWIGVLVWSWLAYMAPHRLTWGFAVNQPWALMIAIATLSGLLINKGWQSIPKVLGWYLLFGLWFIFLLSTGFSYYQEEAWEKFNQVSKILLMTVITLGLFQDLFKLRYLIWVIVLSIGFYGVKGGIWAVLTGGGNMVMGPPSTFLTGNTEIGLALVMILPLLLFLRRTESNMYIRQSLLGMLVLCIVAIIFTYSRGALLGLGVMLALLFLKSRAKVVFLCSLVLVVPIFLSFTPEKWFNRMDTIQNYEEENSAMGRLWTWELAWRMALDRPILGFGFRPFRAEMYERYTPHLPTRSADAHSIYFQVLAEHGFTGLFLYVWLLCWTLWQLQKISMGKKGNPETARIGQYADMTFSGLVGFAVAGAFLSMSYFDLYFHYLAIAMILQDMNRRAKHSEGRLALSSGRNQLNMQMK